MHAETPMVPVILGVHSAAPTVEPLLQPPDVDVLESTIMESIPRVAVACEAVLNDGFRVFTRSSYIG
jgi:hypothetical protein